MTYTKEAYIKALEIIKQAALKNRDEFDKKLKQLYTEFPAIKEIDKEIGAVYPDYAEGKISIEQAKNKSKELQNKRKKMLLDNGYKDDFVFRYNCSKCMDLGYIGSKMCKCLEKELKKQQLLLSNIVSDAQCFENFDLKYYSDTKTTSLGISEREQAEACLKYCKNYADNFSNKNPNLLFMGSVGVGKTFLSGAIAKTASANGISVVYDSAFNIFSKFESQRFDKEGVNTDVYLQCDLLIIDDLGAEFKTSFTEAVLFNIINTRIINKKPMIINTNLSTEEITAQYSERICSRIEGEFIIVNLSCEDIRKQKKQFRK